MNKRIPAALAAVLLSTAALAVVQPAVAQAGQYAPAETDDFDCDGKRDAVYPEGSRSVGSVEYAGGIGVVYSKSAQELWYDQETPGIPESAETEDRFGSAYASFDHNRDGCDDMVVSAPNESVGTSRVAEAGMVWIIPGSPNGLDPSKSFVYSQNSSGVPGSAEKYDHFGSALAAGTTSAGAPFLIIGSTGENGTNGLVHYLRDKKWSTYDSGSPGVIGSDAQLDSFGEVLAANERFFVVGIPTHDGPDNALWESGAVQVFTHGSASARPWAMAGFRQSSSGVSGADEDHDRFGATVSVVSYRASASAAVSALVAVGVPGEDLISNTADAAGAAYLFNVAPGKYTQLSYLDQSAEGVPDSAQDYDGLGSDVVALARDGSAIATPSTAVWVAAVPGETTADGFRGAVHVMRGVKNPGSADIWMQATRHGLSAEVWPGDTFSASSEYLYLGYWGLTHYAVPWDNILNGAQEPVLDYWEWIQ